MSTAVSDPLSNGTSPRTAAIIGAAALVVVAVVAATVNFGVIEALRVPGDATTTAANLAQSAGRVRLAAVGLLVVALLEFAVSWGIYLALRAANPALALLATWLRVGYAIVFTLVIGSLFAALRAAPTDPAQAAFLLESFDTGWTAGFLLFGTHLLLLGFLVWRRAIFARIVAVLVVISGVGYLIDTFGALLSPSYGIEIALFTFVGELVFIVWLFVAGGRDYDRN